MTEPYRPIIEQIRLLDGERAAIQELASDMRLSPSAVMRASLSDASVIDGLDLCSCRNVISLLDKAGRDLNAATHDINYSLRRYPPLTRLPEEDWADFIGHFGSAAALARGARETLSIEAADVVNGFLDEPVVRVSTRKRARRARGSYRASFRLTPPESERLRALMDTVGCTKTDAIRMLINLSSVLATGRELPIAVVTDLDEDRLDVAVTRWKTNRRQEEIALKAVKDDYITSRYLTDAQARELIESTREVSSAFAAALAMAEPIASAAQTHIASADPMID